MSDVEKAIFARLQKVAELFNEKRTAEHVQLYHPNAMVIPMKRNAAKGREAIKATIEDVGAEFRQQRGLGKVKLTHHEVEQLADDFCMVYTTWDWFKTDDSLGGTIKGFGIMKKYEGDWKAYRMMMNE